MIASNKSLRPITNNCICRGYDEKINSSSNVFHRSAVQVQQTIKFLEEKSAFCYEEQALAKYLDHAFRRDIDDMNSLALNRKCEFVCARL